MCELTFIPFHLGTGVQKSYVMWVGEHVCMYVYPLFLAKDRTGKAGKLQ